MVSVVYKRQGEDKWRGPGNVIGRDGKQVLVRHGGIYVRVHACHLQNSHLKNSDRYKFQKITLLLLQLAECNPKV